MWPDNQRLRQYAGDHYEVWEDDEGNPVIMGSIDSNVLLGEITAISTTTTTPAEKLVASVLDGQNALILDMDLLAKNQGWVLRGGQLWKTEDNGADWIRITPAGVEQILRVEFVDSQTGWLVSQDSRLELFIHKTQDGAQTWEAAALPFSGQGLGGIYLEFLDSQTGWLVRKMVSSSSFSIGRLYFTEDGGQTWEERTIPLAEAVHFSDALNGWVAGGPAGDEFYRTVDGGKSWFAASETQSEQIPEGLPHNAVHFSALDTLNAWMLTRSGNCSGEKNPGQPAAEPLRCWFQTRLWNTQDGGETWQEIILQ
jgi:photosystem II stability/assembly factor-like uncharacterized protein